MGIFVRGIHMLFKTDDKKVKLIEEQHFDAEKDVNSLVHVRDKSVSELV